MNIHLIITEKEYHKILKEVIALAKANPQTGTPELSELERLSALIKAYDDEHYS